VGRRGFVAEASAFCCQNDLSYKTLGTNKEHIAPAQSFLSNCDTLHGCLTRFFQLLNITQGRGPLELGQRLRDLFSNCCFWTGVLSSPARKQVSTGCPAISVTLMTVVTLPPFQSELVCPSER
jgi:hypothetical protein